jgi:endothelin-converting enzyme/putative endopeptidase
MDKSVDPCVDFYAYSCGGWRKANPIPPDRTSWGRYGQLYEDNLTLLRSILDRAAAAKDRDAVDQKIGDFYGSCVDEAAVNRLGLSPIKPQLDSIASIKSKTDLASVVAHLQFEDLGGEILFGPGSFQDPDNSDQQSPPSIRVGSAFPIATTTPRTMQSRKKIGNAMYNTSRKSLLCWATPLRRRKQMPKPLCASRWRSRKHLRRAPSGVIRTRSCTRCRPLNRRL